MKYFETCKTEQETKTAYRHLSKILHPDLGGTCELFVELEKQYQAHLKSLNGSYNSKEDEKAGKRQYTYNRVVEEDLMRMIKALQGLRLPETIEISLNGTWIWVKGTCKDSRGNYPVKNLSVIPQLEKLGLKLHTMKGELYYRDPSNRCSNKGKSMSFDRIDRRYQGMRFSSTGADQIN